MTAIPFNFEALTAAIDQAEKDCAQARTRDAYAQRVVNELSVAIQCVQGVLAEAPEGCSAVRNGFTAALDFVREVFDVAQREQERLIEAESRLAQAYDRMRSAERAHAAARRG